MKDNGSTIDVYLMSLPPERRELVTKLRQIILDNLPEGYKEGMEYGMIAYYVPFSLYSGTYDRRPLDYIAISSDKEYVSLYVMSNYGRDDMAFRRAYRETGKKLSVGKSSVRFKHVQEIPVELIAETVSRYTPEELIQLYRRAHP